MVYNLTSWKMTNKDTAKRFWEGVIEYPVFGSKQRRLHEVAWLIPKLDGVETLLDLGCGSGELLELLLRMTDIKKFYGRDLSANLLAKVDKRVDTDVYDIYAGGQLPEVDAIILGCVLQYIFEDDIILKLLESLNCKKLFVRSACNSEELVINKFSEEMGGEYSSRYMTLEYLLKLLSHSFAIVDVRRAYPDNIESKYGTKQWFIECTK